MSRVFSSYNGLAQSINARLRGAQARGVGLEQTLARFGELGEQLEVEKARINEVKTTLMQEKAKSEEFLSKKSSALNDLKRREGKKREEIKRYSQAARESLNNISFEELHATKRHESLERLFKFFFVNLYHEPPEAFDYARFVQIALKEQRNTFQKKLAGFSMTRLVPEQREQIKLIKDLDFSLNAENEGLGAMLEWLDYNYEIYLLLKEQDELKAKIGLVPAVEARYNYIVENKNKLLENCDKNLAQLDRYAEGLAQLRQKISGAWDAFRERPDLSAITVQSANVLSLVENFQNLPEVQEMKKLIG